MHQQGSVGGTAASMMMPPTAMYAADGADPAAAAAASFNGMMTAAGPASFNGMMTAAGPASFNGMMTAAGPVQTGNAAMMMMMNPAVDEANDGGSTHWTSNSADVSNYLSAKAAHMVCTSTSSNTINNLIYEIISFMKCRREFSLHT